MISAEELVIAVLMTRTCGFVLRRYSGVGGLPNAYLAGQGMSTVGDLISIKKAGLKRSIDGSRS